MVYAKKQYGQHFLTDESVCERITDAVKILKNETPNVLEVGPGQGVLTKYLIDKNLNVVEIDPRMIDILQTKFNLKNRAIINQDFLKLNLNPLFDGAPFILIGNYPYNISSQIVFKMIDYRSRIPHMIGMFQKEVAYRFLAKEGSKVYGSISVLLQAFYEGEILFDIGPEAFNPPPKVNSAVMQLRRKDLVEPICEDPLFKSVVKTSFGQRRKMLRNTLKPLVKNKNLLTKDIFMQRPEHLSLSRFIELTKLIKEENNA